MVQLAFVLRHDGFKACLRGATVDGLVWEAEDDEREAADEVGEAIVGRDEVAVLGDAELRIYD